LVKIDLLGIRGLTVLGDVAEAVRSWRQTEYRTGLDVLESIPIDDPLTAELVGRCATIGCFQIEARACAPLCTISMLIRWTM